MRFRKMAACQCQLPHISGEEPEAVRKTLEKLVADPKVTVTIVPVKAADGTLVPQVSVPPSPLLPEVIEAEEKTVHSLGPACPLFHHVHGSIGWTLPAHRRHSDVWNCLYVLRVGYNRAHGKDERIEVKDFTMASR